MKNLSEKVLWLAAGAAVGAIGYMAWKHRDELADLAEVAMERGKEFLESQMPTSEQPQQPAQDVKPEKA